VLNLYHILAKSYVPGDAIFLFGFSAGAATVRALAGFINACGLVDRNHPSVQTGSAFDSDKFQDKAGEAFYCYRSKDKALQQNFKTQYALHDKKHAPNGDLKIKFIGVWDTVSALGFPNGSSVILQGIGMAAEKIANMIPGLAHDFYDIELNDSIENAYHAISIDDKRKAFHPLVWDEKNFKGHVEQVWFAGDHYNVGGKYPRTGLSDAALLWMLTKAQAHGLQFYPDHVTAIQDGANIYDKLSDSQDSIALDDIHGGAGNLYYGLLYGPRNLVKLCESKLKGNIAIHISAYIKIKEFTDSYAPCGIPFHFDVVDIDLNNPASSIIKFHVDAQINQQKPQNKTMPTLEALEAEKNKAIRARKMLYRIIVEIVIAIILFAGYFWVYPPVSATAQPSGLTRTLLQTISVILS
jgi:hypothetical protein